MVKTKILKVLAAVGIIAYGVSAQAVWDGNAVNTDWYNTNDKLFTITTAEQLAGLAQLVNDETDNFSGKTIKLGANIELNNKNWTPIGSYHTNYDFSKEWIPGINPSIITDKSFKGTFDGGGHTVSGMYINNPVDNPVKPEINIKNVYQGLFGSIKDGGTIKNLAVIASNVYAYSGVGILAGVCGDDGVITN